MKKIYREGCYLGKRGKFQTARWGSSKALANVGIRYAIRCCLLLAVLGMAANLLAIRNWQIFTNTTHIYDIQEIDGKIYQATWGGLEVYDIETDSFIKTYSLFDGLEDQNIRSLSYLKASKTLLLGTSKAGINRLKDGAFIMPINEVIGLPEAKVNLIINDDKMLYVATDQGLTTFIDSADFPFPLPVNHFSTHNGLASKKIYSLEIADDYLFVGTDKGLNVVHTSVMNDVTAWNLLNEENSFLPDNNITSISINKDIIAIGTREGLVRAKFTKNYDNKQPPVFSNEKLFQYGTSALDSNKILSVLVDSNQTIWLTHGTWNETNLIINDTRNIVVTSITKDNVFNGCNFNKDGLYTGQVMGFKEIQGKIFIYTWGDGLFYLKDGKWINCKPNRMAANNITDISVDKNGKVWVCNGFIGSDAQMRANPGVSGFDGSEWTIFRKRNSPLVHDKVFTVMTDAKNRKWFGTWNHGISVYDEDKDIWYQYNKSNGLPANEIAALATDEQDNIWISTFSGGVIVLGLDEIEKSTKKPLASFRLYEPNITYSDVVEIFPTKERTFFGSYYSGIRIWDEPGFPATHQPGDAWKKPPMRSPSLSDGYVYIYGIDLRESYWGQEIWIASENGLFMNDTYNDKWYQYGTGIKRQVWLNNSWQKERLYFQDEERLYAAAPTFPTAILIDPFDRIWIGTESNGVTLYDLATDRFSVYNTDNSPLVSNNVTSLAYEPFSGNLFIGTIDGLNAVEIGKSEKKKDVPLSSTRVYPNPFYPEKGQVVRISNSDNNEVSILPVGENRCYIYNINGELILTLKEDSFFEFSWDGNNEHGKKCGSGVYFYVVSSPNGQTDRGTIVLIR